MLKNVLTGIAALMIGVAHVPQAAAQSVAGAYLAGRYAAVQSDYREAASYYAAALALDPSNVELMESTVMAYLALGDIEKATPLARDLDDLNRGTEAARMVVTADVVQQENYKGLLEREPETEGIGPWLDGLVRAWAHVGAGDVTSAMLAFDTLGAEAGIQGLVTYHKALALASVGDFEGAAQIFGSEAAGAAAQTRRGVMAHAEVLAQLERYDDALAVIRDGFGDQTDPELDAIVAALGANEAIPITHARNARSGIAEVFFTFGAVLRSEAAGDHYVLFYPRIAGYLQPDHTDAALLTAGLLENLGQNQLAIEVYQTVTPQNPAFHVAELGRAAALRRAGKEDQAVEVLQQLTRSHSELPVVHSTLGDVLRAQDDYKGAVAAYDRALELVSDTASMRWVIYYSRGIAYERMGDMDASEADFRAALAINPEQPQVLNYLGYSMVEQKRNLDEALEMIERAVAASPNSGYIVDSLGWVLYRLGRYEEAVLQMERAVELLPVDPVVNDHLGDVYWAVGRHREARFQWSRALSFIGADDTDSEADPERIRRKLDVGLDAVLAEEGAPPLMLSNDI